MPSEFGRNRRVAKEIQRELGPLVQQVITNVHGTMASVTGVDVAPDLRQATVYVSCFGAAPEQALAEIRAAKSVLRHHLATHLRMKVVPSLFIKLDESIERGARMSALLDKLKTTAKDENS